MTYIDPFTQQKHYSEHPLDDYPVGIGENSWYLKLSLSKCRNLFVEDYGYEVHAYACKCGKERVIISDKNIVNIPYVCSQCDNNGFLDVDNLDMYEECLINIDVPAEFSIVEDIAFARLFIPVPKTVDLARGEKIIYEKKKIFEIEKPLINNETIYKGWEKITSDAQERVEHELLYYIGEHYLKNTILDYEDLCIKQRSLPQLRKAISFFLKYEFKHSEMLSWAVMDDDLYHNGGVEKTPQSFLEYIRNYRTEKSVKRSLYKRYKEELAVGKYYPITSYIICRIFTDPNHICKMLDNYYFVFTYYSGYQSLSLYAASHIRFVEFLKERYSEKQIVKMFENMGDNPSYWIDSVDMYQSLFDIEQITDHFQLPRANVRAIHDELVRSRHLAENNYKSVDFTYTQAQLKPCCLWHNKFKLVLPRSSDELTIWSKQLHNCLYGYIESVYNHNTTIYGVKQGNVLRYAIEVQKNGSLVQMKGPYNEELQEDMKRSLNAWYHFYFAMTSKRSTDEINFRS